MHNSMYTIIAVLAMIIMVIGFSPHQISVRSNYQKFQVRLKANINNHHRNNASASAVRERMRQARLDYLMRILQANNDDDDDSNEYGGEGVDDNTDADDGFMESLKGSDIGFLRDLENENKSNGTPVFGVRDKQGLNLSCVSLKILYYKSNYESHPDILPCIS